MEVPEKPEDSTMIQISFLFAENYEFIATQPLAAAQIFHLLPQALAHGGNFNLDENTIVMHSIVPYDTLDPLEYITSQALVYYPSEGIEQLRLDIKSPNSALYNHENELVRNLTKEINPAIDIILGSTLEGDNNNGGDGGYPSDTGAPNNDPFNSPGNPGGASGSQKGMAAGIAVGAASVAGAYGAAMFIIARRYKKKKQAHKRSSSVASYSDMRQSGSPALMGGALLSRDFTGYGAAAGNMRDSRGSGRSGGNTSARTANISAPVAAENSLGWN